MTCMSEWLPASDATGNAAKHPASSNLNWHADCVGMAMHDCMARPPAAAA